ncbi:MAG TPA: LptA/OstA family protein [Abditibacteriaceae bacterium]|jgi:lipopolysaccharide export system protein LptA
MKTRIFLAASVGVLAIAAWSQTVPSVRPANPAQMKPAKARRGDVRIRNAADGTAVYNNRTGISRISKNVVVTQEGEDFILRAEQISYNENTNEAIGSGNLRIESRNSTITGGAIRADFDTKTIIITGNVVMNSHGEGNGLQSARDVKRKPSQITCDRVDYNYGNRQAIITGNILMKQEKNAGTCERITFDEDSNYARLEGAVSFRNTETGQMIRSTDVEVWIDDNIVKASNRTTVTGPNKEVQRTAPPKTNVPERPVFPSDIGEQFGRPLPPAPTPAPPQPEPDDETSARASATPAPETDRR